MEVKPYTFDDVRLAYTAGLFDGEGCVGVYRSGKYHHASLRIKIDNTDKNPLQFVHTFLGGVITERTPALKHHKLCYMWRLNGMPAAEVLEKLLPYLIVKRKRATLGIECMGASEKRQSEIIDEMHELNERGSV